MIDQQHLSEADKESLHVALKIKRQEMEEIIRYKTAGAILISKLRWYNEGERNTKYFHSLEKRHFNCKTLKLKTTLEYQKTLKYFRKSKHSTNPFTPPK